MKGNKLLLLILLSLGLQAGITQATQEEAHDYYKLQREMIQHGVQAVLLCNGLFTSDRTIEQVFEQELAYLRHPVGSARGGDYFVDYERKAVQIGVPGGVPPIRAAYRNGVGCVVMPPDQTFEDIPDLPQLALQAPIDNTRTLAWPDGDLVEEQPLPAGINADALLAASDWAFDRESAEQVTLSLVIVHDGQIIHERYADGVDRYTKTRTWSTAKSIAVTLIGQLVDQGLLSLDTPLDLPWNPEIPGADQDPRGQITLRHLLNMSSGLYPVDSYGMEYATGSGLAYWAGASSVQGALDRGLVRRPGTHWDYENYDTLLAVLAMKRALQEADMDYHRFPYESLLHKIGMYNTVLSMDRFGDFILSSQVYTNALDLARFGLLYEQGGTWKGERLISEDWIDFVRTPAPATADRGNFYGGQWWLVPDNRLDVPRQAYSTAGNRGQYVLVDPSHDLVIVRRGLDYGRQGFNRWDLLREVLKAFEGG